MTAAITPTGKVGRPPRIDRRAIAQAVLDLGLDGISMKAVADHLGVSVAGLYHHVRNRRELLVLAAESTLSRVPMPEDTGQHWDEWLREWARHTYASYVNEPEILVQFMSGALAWESMVDVVDSVIKVLGRDGFGPADAVAAFSTVAQCAVGAAVAEIRERGATSDGRPVLSELHRMVATRPAGELAGVRALLELPPTRYGTDFEDHLTTVLAGLAVRRGEEWRPILERAAGPARPARGAAHPGQRGTRPTGAAAPAAPAP
jgi:AcrR family transcriptional regulator